MTSLEADRFMVDHPEVAVTVAKSAWVVDGERWPWVVWDDVAKHQGRRWGSTREDAIAAFRDAFYPQKPHPAYNDHIDQQAKVFADSAKYREIVHYFKGCGTKKELRDIFDYHWLVNAIRRVLGDDLGQSCDKCRRCRSARCGQKLDSDE